MTDTASNELELVKKFLKAYKIEEALQHVKNIQNRNKLAPEESLKALYYKSLINFYLGNFKKTYQIAEELYQRSQDMEIPIFSLDALFCKELALHGQGRLEEMDEIIEQHAKLFKSIQR
ncbi:MAG: hypothetical protein ACXAEX_19385 [Promethearchaeota archaeon]|jgi:hypothetical protein